MSAVILFQIFSAQGSHCIPEITCLSQIALNGSKGQLRLIETGFFIKTKAIIYIHVDFDYQRT